MKLFSFLYYKNKFELHYKVCKNQYYYVQMPNGDDKILKYNHGEKSMKVLFVIYANLEYLLQKMRNNNHNNHNNPEKP